MIKLSLVILCYSQEKYIEECLNSILLQGNVLSRVELIISDDNSKDKTGLLIKSWVKKNSHSFFNVKCFFQTKNLGISDNHEFGVSMATCNIIKYIGGDDVFLPNAIKTYINYFETTKNVDVVCTDIILMKENSYGLKYMGVRPKKENQKYFNLSAIQQFERLSIDNFIPAPGICFRRKLLDKYKLFNSNFKKFEDWPTWLELTRNGVKVHKLDYSTLIWRRHENAISNDPFKKKDLEYYTDEINTIDIYIKPYLRWNNIYTRYIIKLKNIKYNILVGYGFTKRTKLLLRLLRILEL